MKEDAVPQTFICMLVIISGVSVVNTTRRTEGDLKQNKALRMDSELEKMWAVVMISWIILYAKGKKIISIPTYLPVSFLGIELMTDFIKSQVSRVDFWHGLYI